MHTLNKQIELYTLLHDNGYVTALDDVNELTEEEVNKMINKELN